MTKNLETKLRVEIVDLKINIERLNIRSVKFSRAAHKVRTRKQDTPKRYAKAVEHLLQLIESRDTGRQLNE